MHLDKLLAKRASLQGQLDKLLEDVTGADSDPTDEQIERAKELEASIAKIDAMIAAAEADRERRAAAATIQVHSAADADMADVTVTTGDRITVTGVRERLLDDPKRGFPHFGEFAYAVYGACHPSRSVPVDERIRITAATGMSMGTGSDGGFLVPPEFSTKIYSGLMSPSESLLSMTDNYSVTGESLTFVANAETSRDNGSRWGGVQGYWISEAQQITSSKPKTRQVKIEPQQLAVLVYATDKLLKNTAAAATYLTQAARDEISFKVGDAIINGDGAGKPVGIVGHAATVNVAKESGQVAGTLVKANIDKMWSRCHARMRRNAVWLINQDIEPQLESMFLATGTTGFPVYLPAGGISNQPFATLKGRPVMPIEYCATLGTSGDIILADLSAYVTGTRGGVDEAMSMHLRFDYAETAFRFMFEVDGQPWIAEPLAPFKGTTNTLSPFVTLATRA
ncbi:MAG: hypothetical protein JETCAE02_27060 [Anaerolineaceae bacterium]|nr:MAG: hypothetical protein JETCAE02_27060 [Anaerolineaceae bacterium]